GQICWPSPGSFTGHQRAHQLAARGQILMAIDSQGICFGRDQPHGGGEAALRQDPWTDKEISGVSH
ncbi:hypothetical protein, partial [Pseudarthrobacter sulfonivorans]|uniref:hypothetical protein n=1 Tax=Pseudarthrobacter sulfonivorans TaxID=121292 RepID=UPI0027D79A7B